MIRKELYVFSAINQYLLHIIEMPSIAKQPASICYYENRLSYRINEKSLNDDIGNINKSLYDNILYKISLRFDEPMDYIDLSLIKDNIETMEIIYNSNCNMNKMVMISCKDKKNLKEIILNFNTDERIYCGISDCSGIKNICINGGNNALTNIKTKISPYSRISIRGYNTNSICVSDSTMIKLELKKIDDLLLNHVYYMTGYGLTGPMTERLRYINKLDIDDLDRL